MLCTAHHSFPRKDFYICREKAAGAMRLALSLLLAWVALTMGVELTNEQEENMPDFGDPKVGSPYLALDMACSVSRVE